MLKAEFTHPRILVTDAGLGSAITIIRSLGRKGWQVIAADSQPRSLGFRSRYAHEHVLYPAPETAPGEFVRTLLQFSKENGIDLIIPVTNELETLQKQQLISIYDAATVVRKADGKVKVKQSTNLVGAGALGGAFWGMLIGLLFVRPWIGMAIGAVSGAIAGKFTDMGIEDDFIEEVGTTIQPGHSALFLMIEEWTEDKVLHELAKHEAKILRTNLSAEDEAKLREAFSAHED